MGDFSSPNTTDIGEVEDIRNKFGSKFINDSINQREGAYYLEGSINNIPNYKLKSSLLSYSEPNITSNSYDTDIDNNPIITWHDRIFYKRNRNLPYEPQVIEYYTVNDYPMLLGTDQFTSNHLGILGIYKFIKNDNLPNIYENY